MKIKSIVLVIFIISMSTVVFSQGGWIEQFGDSQYYFTDVQFIDSEKGWAVSMYGKIVFTDNGGSTWSAQSSGTSSSLYSLHFVNGSTGWAVGSSGTIIKTVNGGSTWQSLSSPTSRILKSVYFVDDSTGWVAGDYSVLYKSTNGGSSWSQQSLQNTDYFDYGSDDIHCVFFVDSTHGWLVGSDYGCIFRTTNGSTWAEVSVIDEEIISLHFVNSATGWAVGPNGEIFKTTNGGSSWTAQSSGISDDLNAVHFSDSLNGWAVGEFSAVLKTTNGGSTWIKDNNVPEGYSFTGVYQVDSTLGWVVGGSRIFKYSESSGTDYSLTVDVDNIPGGSTAVPSVHGRVQLYDESYNPIGLEKQTNADGITTFYNLESGDYNVEAYVVSPFGLGTEFWGGMGVFINNSNESVTLIRDYPYIESVQVENAITGAPIDWGDTVAFGTEVRFNIRLRNPHVTNKTSYCAAYLDQNKDTSFDYSGSDSPEIIISYNQMDYSIDLGPINSSGAHYFGGRAFTYVNNNYTITDTWGYDDTQVIYIAGDDTHDLTITVNNVSVGSTDVPGNYGTVRLYDSTGSDLLSSQQTSNGQVVFPDLANGDYVYRVYVNYTPSGLGAEFWGHGFVTISGQDKPESFTRDMPYVEQVTLENLTEGIPLNWGDTVSAGTQIRLKIKVKNPNTDNVNCYVTGILDRNRDTSFDYADNSTTSTIISYNWITYNVDLGPINTEGEYSFAARTYSNYGGSYTVTDTSAYDDSQIIFVQPGYSLTIDVDNVLGGDSSVPGTSGRVYLYDEGWSALDYKQTDADGLVTFSDLVPATYGYRVYIDSPSGLGTEFWGDGNVVIDSNKPIVHTRNWPYVVADVTLENAGDSESINWGDTIPIGTTINVKITVKNPNPSAIVCNATAIFDQDQSHNSHDFSDSSGDVAVAGNDEHTFTVPITISGVGNFYYAGLIKSYYPLKNLNELTDTNAFNETQVIKVETIYSESILTVPYYYQYGSHWCWAACVAMVLEYFGYEKKIWEIAADLDKEKNTSWWEFWKDAGADGDEVVAYLNQWYGNGYVDSWIKETVNTLSLKNKIKAIITNGSPVWLGKYGIQLFEAGGHAIVITGYDDNYVYIHDPSGALFSFPQINHQSTWSNFLQTLENIRDQFDLIYARPGRFVENHGTTSISTRPSGIDFINSYMLAPGQKRQITLEWDGADHLHGYYFISDDPNWYQETDANLGYKATKADLLTLSDIIYNFTNPLETKSRKVMIELRTISNQLVASFPQLSELKNVPSSPNPYTDPIDEVEFLKYEICNLDIGQYKIIASVIDDNENLEDSYEILFFVADSSFSSAQFELLSESHFDIPFGSKGIWIIRIINKGSQADIFTISTTEGEFYLQNSLIGNSVNIGFNKDEERILELRFDDYTHIGETGNIEISATSNTDFQKSYKKDLSYTIVQPLLGQLRVEILPTEAVNVGAQWKLLSESIWHDSGEILTFSPGDYIVEFNAIDGWIKPDNSNVSIIGGQLTEIISQYTVLSPTIHVFESALTPSCTEGHNASSDALHIWNSGDGTLNFSISDTADWLACSPASGTSSGETITIDVNYNTSSLAANTYNATITISDPNATNDPVQIPVTLSVNPDGDVPVITTHPQSQSIDYNTSTSLSISATGTQPLNYQWYQGNSGDESSPVGTNSDTYPTPKLIQTTSYWVKVTNSFGYDNSNTAIITVNPLIFITDKTDVTVPENGTGTFQVKLSSEPISNFTVSVSRSSGDSDITVQTGANLTFTTSGWSAYQTVILAAADDADTTNGPAVFQITASGIPTKEINATEQDDDVLNFVTDTNQVTVPEGSTANFQVKLSDQPPSNVTVTVSHYSGDSDISVQSGSTLQFTTSNWDAYQTVTLAAEEDTDATNGEAIIRISGLGLASKDITATEQDDEIGQPEIYILFDSTEIPSGGNADFGSAQIGEYLDETFTIENTGTGDLTLGNVDIEGDDADQFTVAQQPVSPVESSAFTNLIIRFTPTSSGLKTASISIPNNDSDEDLYIVNITGLCPDENIEIYGFNEGTGTTFTDDNGGSNTGTIYNGAEWVTSEIRDNNGQTGYAIKYDGVDDYSRLENQPFTAGPFTLMFWAKKLGQGGGSAWIQLIRAAAPGSSSGYCTYWFNDNSVQALVCTDSSKEWLIYANGEENKWTHIAVTLDNSSAKLFINGNLETEEDITGTLNAPNWPFSIGGQGGGVDAGYFNGVIDGLKTFSRAVSEAEVQNIYTQEKPDSGDSLYFDDFEDGDIVGWDVSQTEVTASTDNPKNGSYSMKMYDNTSSSNPWVTLTLDSNSSRIGVEYYEWTNDFGWNGGSTYRFTTTTEPYVGWAYIWGAQTYTQGNWRYINSQNKADYEGINPWHNLDRDFPTPVSHEANTWHKIKVEVYGPEGKAKFWYDDEYKGEVDIAPTTNPLKYFRHYISWSSPTGTTNYIDDIRFYEIGAVPTPTILFLNPSTGPIGTEVTISGANFGTTEGAVSFNGEDAIIVSWVDNEIKSIVPAAAVTGPVVVHTAGGDDSNEIGFVVSGVPPSIISHSQNQTVNYNSQVVLTVTATGTPPLHYQWHQGVSGDTSSPVGTDSNTYTTPQLTSDVSYWIKVYNDYGSVDSNTITITVIPIGVSPTITIQPQSQIIGYNTKALLSVTATGTAPLNYQWYEGASGDVSGPIGGAVFSTYQTPDLVAAANYWVRVSNAYGFMDSITAIITVGDQKYNLTISANSGGTTDPLPGTYLYNIGTTAELRAVPDPGYRFSHWTGQVNSGTETNNPLTVLMDTNKSITANFVAMSWDKINNKSPEGLVSVDLDNNGTDEVIGDYGSLGLWSFDNNTSWRKLNKYNAEVMCTGDLDGDGKKEVVVGFSVIGLWVYDHNTSWRKINNYCPEVIACGDLDNNGQDEVMGDFSSLGLWAYDNNAIWRKLNNNDAEVMACGDIDGNGQAEVVVGFDYLGLWAYDNNLSWRKINNYCPEVIACGDLDDNGQDEVLGDFSSLGLWAYDNNAIWRKLNNNDVEYFSSGDLDGNGKCDVVGDFGSLGLWVFDNNSSWRKINNKDSLSLCIGSIKRDDLLDVISDFQAIGLWIYY